MLESSDTFTRVRKAIVDNLGVKEESVVPTARLAADLGADSLDYVDLIMDLEDDFCIKIADSDVEKIVTVQDIVDHIEASGQKDPK